MKYYCPICEKIREGYRLTINDDIYFVCVSGHKSRMGIVKEPNEKYSNIGVIFKGSGFYSTDNK